MSRLLLMVTAIVLNSVTSNADTVVVIPDTPNVGDFTTVTTVTTGNPVTTGNLISQTFNDGTWNGTMFPDSSDISEDIYLTGKHDTYAETTINSEDHVSLEELRLGFSSNFNADIRWWNPTESTVTMYQIASNGVDTTTQSTTFEDTTNHNYEFNNYGNTLIMNADPNMTHGTLTAGFSFDIIGNKNYNGGHAGVDVKDPTLQVNYQALSSTTVTEITYCWQQLPPTCPGQDEIDIVEDIIDDIDTIIYDIPDDFFEPEPIPIDIEYSFNPDLFEEEEFDIQDEYLVMDEFFFEDDYYQDDFYEDIELAYISETNMDMDVEVFDELPPIEVFEEMPIIEEVYEAVPETMFVEEFTEEMQEEFIEEVEEYFEEIVNADTIEDPVETGTNMELAEGTATMDADEEFVEVVEEIIEEEPTEEIASEIEEQSSSEEPIANEPEPATEVAEQEEAIEKPIKAEPKGDVEVDLDIKVAKIEQAIQGKIKNVAQQIDATLTVINEVVSREMISQEPDMSSYFNTNMALFDAKELPSGNLDFFIQASLNSYSKPIYVTQVSIAGTDPVVQHQIKVNNAKQKTNQAYRKLKELLNARNVQ